MTTEDNDTIDYRLKEKFAQRKTNNLARSLREQVKTLEEKKADLEESAALLKASLSRLDEIQENLKNYGDRSRAIVAQIEALEEKIEEQ